MYRGMKVRGFLLSKELVGAWGSVVFKILLCNLRGFLLYYFEFYKLFSVDLQLLKVFLLFYFSIYNCKK